MGFAPIAYFKTAEEARAFKQGYIEAHKDAGLEIKFDIRIFFCKKGYEVAIE